LGVPVNKTRSWLRKYHIWLGWVIGLPMLAWTVSGLIMVIRPIEHVRGEHLLGEAPVLQSEAVPVPPQIGPRPVASLLLEQRADGAKWVIRYADGDSRLADAATGRLLPRLDAAGAAKAVSARYAGDASIKTVDFVSREDPPIDLRRKVDSWRVSMSDGTRFYVNAATGEIIARRTAFWRIYDFMWGLHIMDLKTREDTSNPLVIGFGIVTLVTTILAIILLPLTLRRKKKG
jgi:uncharacterized iron-regulated membrane protein